MSQFTFLRGEWAGEHDAAACAEANVNADTCPAVSPSGALSKGIPRQ